MKTTKTIPFCETPHYLYLEKKATGNILNDFDKFKKAFPNDSAEDLIDIYKWWNETPKPLFKGVFNFDDVFEKYLPHSYKKLVGNETHIFSNSCYFMGEGTNFEKVEVKANKKFLDAICNTMLAIKYDTKYFEIFLRKDGTADVYCKYNQIYNQIIGSRFVCTIKTDSIPVDFPKE